MRSVGRLLLKNPFLSALYVLLILIYVLQAVLPAPDKTTLVKYGLTVLHAKMLGLTVEVPYVIIWIISLIGYLRLKTYAELIKGNKDGEAFRVIAQGILFLILWLPISSIVSNYFSEIYRYHPSATANLVRVNTYFQLIFLFIGFLLVYLGSIKLLPLISKNRFQASMGVILSYIAFTTLYTFLTLHDPARSATTSTVSVATYYEPDWLIITSAVIPRLMSWFIGLQAAYNIYLYHKKVKGTLYRSAVKNLAFGLAGAILTTILLRCLQSLTSVLNGLNLGVLLSLIYILLIIIAAGYILIENGANKLQKIEET